MPHDPLLPPHDELADPDDELGWDRELHGRMVEFATEPDDEPKVMPLTFEALPEEVRRALHDADRS